MYVIRIVVLKETYCCNSNLKVNIAAKMVIPKVTTLFDATGCELVKKKRWPILVPADSYAVLIFYNWLTARMRLKIILYLERTQYFDCKNYKWLGV